MLLHIPLYVYLEALCFKYKTPEDIFCSFHHISFPLHNYLQLFFTFTPLSQEVIWKVSFGKQDSVFKIQKPTLQGLKVIFYLSTQTLMIIVHQLPNYFFSWDPYCNFLITENNSSLVLISWRRFVFSIRYHQQAFSNQGLQIYIVTTQGNFPSNTGYRIK